MNSCAASRSPPGTCSAHEGRPGPPAGPRDPDRRRRGAVAGPRTGRRPGRDWPTRGTGPFWPNWCAAPSSGRAATTISSSDSPARKPPTDAATLTLLRLSLHQMLGQEAVPAYAAIHQAGELCRLQPGNRKVPFVNGLLQSVRREVLGEGETTDPTAVEDSLRPFFETPSADPAAGLAAWHSHPAWLVRQLGRPVRVPDRPRRSAPGTTGRCPCIPCPGPA